MEALEQSEIEMRDKIVTLLVQWSHLTVPQLTKNLQVERDSVMYILTEFEGEYFQRTKWETEWGRRYSGWCTLPRGHSNDKAS